jgi:alpha-mannosidase
MAERGFGVALLNDGKYGHHALGNELGISLLRSPVSTRRVRCSAALSTVQTRS